MEDKIKNFDRAIEQRMNEAEVTPPFGSWNRIAAEIDAAAPIAPPAPSPAPVSIMPGRGLMGFFAGAMVLGVTLATIYLGQLSADKKAPVQTVKANTDIVAPKTVAPAAELKAAVIPVAIKAEAPVYALRTKKEASSAVTPVMEQAKVTEPAPATVMEKSLPSNALSEVPAPQNVAANNTNEATNQVYYFPPVDINMPEKTPASNHVTAAGPKPETAKSPDDDDDDKKVKGNSENKVKFKPHKRHKFNYGTIIRVK